MTAKLLGQGLVALTLFAGAAALAQQPAPEKVEVLERDAQGRPVRIRLEGYEYRVCTREGEDGCINPREAGLDFGNRPIEQWTGKPASEKHPEAKPAPQ